VPQLSPPRVVEPLWVCSDGIRFQGQVTGAQVTFRVVSTSWGGGNFAFVAASSDEIFTLPHDLEPGDKVVDIIQMAGARGSSVGVPAPQYTVPPRPAPTDIHPPSTTGHVYACGTCIALGGVFMGAKVTLTSAAGGPLGGGRAEADGGVARFPLTRPIAMNDVLTATQDLCGLVQSGSITAPEQPDEQRIGLPAPTFDAPVECDQAVLIHGILEGAQVTVEVDGAIFTACGDYQQELFGLGRELHPPSTVSVSQAFPKCELRSPSWPQPAMPVQPASTIPPPWVGPACRDNKVVAVGGLRKGALVVISLDNQEIGGGEAWADTCTFAVVPLLHNVPGDFGDHKLTAVAHYCGQTLTSAPRTVDLGIDVLERPSLPDTPVECATVVRVARCHPGATVQVWMETPSGRRPISDPVFAFSPILDIPVTPPLVRNGDVWAEELGCNDSTRSDPVPIKPLGDLVPPIVRACHDHLSVSGARAGIRTEVYVDGKYFWGGTSGAGSFSIPTAAPLRQGATLAARQIACGQTSQLRVSGSVDNDADNVRLRWVSTEWRGQLAYDHNYPNNPVANRTDAFDALGTDLGISVDHQTAGEHRTYIFFGDTAADHGSSTGDAITWTTDAAPRTHAPFGVHLNFVTEEHGYYRRLVVPATSMEGFEVPTGALSHDNELYVFVTTDHEASEAAGCGAMGTSLLVSAADPSQDFAIHYTVDSFRRHVDAQGHPDAAKMRFINISPQVVDNDTIPGLPGVATAGGKGIVMVGSGKYRESKPYLAYAPLPPGGAPPLAQWRYFSGFTPAPGFGPLGRPQWDPDINKAKELFSTYSWIGELSFSYSPALGLWLLMFGQPVQQLASSRWPWGPWTLLQQPGASAPGTMFDTARDNQLNFVDIGAGGSPYGSYVIRRYTTFETATQQATLYYTMSSWKPYAPHLMRTVVQLECI